MADKEEMILILTTKNEDGECATQDGCFANDRYAICSASMTRQEAIEVMAKAIFNKCYEYTYKWEVANEETKTIFRLYAREALNALLEGEK